MWTDRHCRHCGDLRTKGRPVGIKKRDVDGLLPDVRAHIAELASLGVGTVTKEAVARMFHVPAHIVEQCFHRLNLEGMLSRPLHEAPHDSRRDPWCYGSGDSAWVADRYRILAVDAQREASTCSDG